MPQALTTLSNQKASPKWTFRGRYGNASPASTSPGPGLYDSVAPDGSSKFSKAKRTVFGSGKRDGPGRAGQFGSPGPGLYTPRAETVKTSNPRFKFGTSTR